MNPKRYDGYTSYQYLVPGEDFPDIELDVQIDRVASTRVPTSDQEEARVARLMTENLVISLHDHCFVAPKDLSRFLEFRRYGRDHTGYEGLAQSGLDAVSTR
jgi:hypothetical protein